MAMPSILHAVRAALTPKTRADHRHHARTIRPASDWTSTALEAVGRDRGACRRARARRRGLSRRRQRVRRRAPAVDSRVATRRTVHLNQQPDEVLRPGRPAVRMGDCAVRYRRAHPAHARRRRQRRQRAIRTTRRARLPTARGARRADAANPRRQSRPRAGVFPVHGRSSVLPAPPSSSIVFARLGDASATRAFVQRLLDVHGVAVAPGHFFESPDHFRVSLAGDPDVLAEGLRRLGAALDAE